MTSINVGTPFMGASEARAQIAKTRSFCAAKKRNGEQCTHYALPGSTHCRVHGGNMPRNPMRGCCKELVGMTPEMLAGVRSTIMWTAIQRVVELKREIAAMEDFPQKRDVIVLLQVCVYDMLSAVDK